MMQAAGLRDRKKQGTWRDIRSSAIDQFLERGFEAVSIDDIAAAAGISRATFFNYFTSKEAVVFDPDPGDADRVRELLAARPLDESAFTSVQEVMAAYLVSLDRRSTVTRKLIATSPALAASSRTMGDHTRPVLRAWLRDRHPTVPELDIAVLVDIGVGATLTAFRLWKPGQGRARLHEMVRHSLELTGSDLAARPPGSGAPVRTNASPTSGRTRVAV